MILEGTYTTVVRYTLPDLSRGVQLYTSDGWRIAKFEKERNWPYFWECTYVVIFAKDIIVDQKYIIETPLTELK